MAANCFERLPANSTMLDLLCFLSSDGLARMELTCTRLAAKVIVEPIGDLHVACSTHSEAADDGDLKSCTPVYWSSSQEVARRNLCRCTAQERSWAPRRRHESWTALLHEVELLQRPLVFSCASPLIALSQGGAKVALHLESDEWTEWHPAVCEPEMRAGRHLAEFTIIGAEYPYVRVQVHMLLALFQVSQSLDAEIESCNDPSDSSAAESWSDRMAVAYHTSNGRRTPGQAAWHGMRCACRGDKIGLLLNIDEGSLEVFKNDQRLGMMMRHELVGCYRWGVAMNSPGDRVHMLSKPLL